MKHFPGVLYYKKKKKLREGRIEVNLFNLFSIPFGTLSHQKEVAIL